MGNMPMFYLTLRVVPTSNNSHVNDVEGALASCWVLDDDPQSALAKASFKVRQRDWDIVKVEKPPIKTTQKDFAGKDIGLEQYKRAQEQGSATVYCAWAKDGKSSYGPVTLKRSDNFDLALSLSESKSLRRKGRCLHYNASSRCSKIINAHSIQKRGALSLIANNGQVYAISTNFGDTKRSRGGVTFAKHGINTFSTFRGFCEKHDSQVFAPIDKVPLAPTKHQILLYGYRALCREVFVKENALLWLEKHAERNRGQPANHELFDNMRRGTKFGFDNLVRQKRKYDKSLRARSFSDIRSVIFCSSQEPSVVFSGLFYPDFDFLGNKLQDLGDHSTPLDLLTFSFVPMSQGWGILFAWHSESSGACVPFLKSLATRIYEDRQVGDRLFRLVVCNCENVAMRPRWWESLPERTRITIAKAACYGTDIFKPLRHDYLVSGLANISGWNFESVISDMD